MSAPKWMPLYVDDYLGATTHLSTIEHGAYLLLLLHYWQKGGLPTDEKVLRRICRMDAKAWKRAAPSLGALFVQPSWAHPRVDLELRKAFEKSKASSANARFSHQSRKRSAGANAHAIAQRTQTHNTYRESSFVTPSERATDPGTIAVSEELERHMATKKGMAT